MDRPSVRSIFNVGNARKILRSMLTSGTGWLKVVGSLILLTADIWLGVSVFQAAGMDIVTSVLLSVALSALQISLFQRGIQILQRSQTNWQYIQGVGILVIGWIVVLGDSILDGSAAFVKMGGSLPKSWSEFGIMLKNPYVFLGYILFFCLSFLGERMARLAIYGEHDEEEEQSVARAPRPSPEEILAMREAARQRERDSLKPMGCNA